MSNSSIRGAVTIEHNTKENILYNTKLLLNEIIKQNDIYIDDIISIIFTATKDIDAAYPAVAARELEIIHAGLMCFQEMYVKDSLKMCIRILVNIETDKKQKEMKHIYLKDAKKLRPDLANKEMCIAIDGPAGSGKSTIAKLIAKELNFIYVDSGAMYRTVALYCIENNINLDNDVEVKNVLENITIDFKHENYEQRIFLNGKDVTDLIRTQNVAEGSSKVAVIFSVREKLVDIQRKIAQDNNIVMDGRDIGTFVFPNADIKIYMDADISERAKRRYAELKEKKIECNIEQIKKDIIARDDNDKNRKYSPLKKSQDAISIDSTKKGIEEVKNDIISIIKQKLY